jgi:hypothetical protein
MDWEGVQKFVQMAACCDECGRPMKLHIDTGLAPDSYAALMWLCDSCRDPIRETLYITFEHCMTAHEKMRIVRELMFHPSHV